MIEPRESIKNLQDYKPPIDARLDKFRYDFNENVLGASPKAIDALRNIDPLKISTYPEYEQYYSRISNYFGIEPNEMLLSNGTDEAIKLILETYMEEGDEMILPTPTFAMFKFYAQRIGIAIKEILYNEDLSFPTDRVLNSINDQTRIVVLVNPNNPTGTSISQIDVEKIVQKAKSALVLIDEAYYDFAKDNSHKLLKKYDNIIILRTFSKSIGLAGLRIGMAIAKPDTISILKKSSSPYNVSAIACHIAAAALEDKSYATEYISKVINSRKMVTKKLTEWNFKVYPSSSNFLLIDFGYISKWIVRYLRSHKILVRDRSNYPLLNNCIRITLGDQSDSERLLNTINSARKISPIIFDMDSVLVDVTNSYREAIALTVEQFTSKKPTTEEIQLKKNDGGFNNDWKLSHALISDSGMNINLEDVISVFQKFYLGNEKYNGLIQNETWLLDYSVLEELRNKYPLFIFTGRPREEAEYVLHQANTMNYFDSIITMDETPDGKGKPDPWGLNQIMNDFEIKTGYYFGDTGDDMIAARKANLLPIGVISNNKDDKMKDFLIGKGAKEVITIDQVLEVIK